MPEPHNPTTPAFDFSNFDIPPRESFIKYGPPENIWNYITAPYNRNRALSPEVIKRAVDSIRAPPGYVFPDPRARIPLMTDKPDSAAKAPKNVGNGVEKERRVAEKSDAVDTLRTGNKGRDKSKKARKAVEKPATVTMQRNLRKRSPDHSLDSVDMNPQAAVKKPRLQNPTPPNTQPTQVPQRSVIVLRLPNLLNQSNLSSKPYAPSSSAPSVEIPQAQGNRRKRGPEPDNPIDSAAGTQLDSQAAVKKRKIQTPITSTPNFQHSKEPEHVHPRIILRFPNIFKKSTVSGHESCLPYASSSEATREISQASKPHTPKTNTTSAIGTPFKSESLSSNSEELKQVPVKVATTGQKKPGLSLGGKRYTEAEEHWLYEYVQNNYHSKGKACDWPLTVAEFRKKWGVERSTASLSRKYRDVRRKFEEASKLMVERSAEVVAQEGERDGGAEAP
ncbi:hypothetical protein RUND412_003029 [Rhizina undulata]